MLNIIKIVIKSDSLMIIFDCSFGWKNLIAWFLNDLAEDFLERGRWRLEHRLFFEDFKAIFKDEKLHWDYHDVTDVIDVIDDY